MACYASVVIRQLDLFSAPVVGFDAGFGEIVRHELAHGAWLDYQPGWVRGHDRLFDELERGLDWRSEERHMYERTVTVPRLLASVPAPGTMGTTGTTGTMGTTGAVLEQMRQALSARYGEDFVRLMAALYRDGNDSVAWHGDTTARDMDQALVATVSLGEPRRFLLKPADGGRSIAFSAGRGDLIVMGGTCQRTWRHAIPKVAHAGPRIALMFRPAWFQRY